MFYFILKTNLKVLQKNIYGLIAHGFTAKYVWFYVKLKNDKFL